MGNNKKPQKGETCCSMRLKQPLVPMPYIPEEICGIPDSVMTDFMRFDLSVPPGPNGKQHAVIGFAYCPWCGKKIDYKMKPFITDIHHSAPDEESGEEWKK